MSLVPPSPPCAITRTSDLPFTFIAAAMPSVAWLALPLALSAIGRGIAQPSMMGLVSRAGSAGNRGAVMGTFTSMASLARVFVAALARKLEPLTFLDLDLSLVERALAREREQRRSGPIAENMLRDLGTVASRPG